ncbi:hypothetical protein Dimus_029180 [Dionaea muscipula]
MSPACFFLFLDLYVSRNASLYAWSFVASLSPTLPHFSLLLNLLMLHLFVTSYSLRRRVYQNIWDSFSCLYFIAWEVSFIVVLSSWPEKQCCYEFIGSRHIMLYFCTSIVMLSLVWDNRIHWRELVISQPLHSLFMRKSIRLDLFKEI